MTTETFRLTGDPRPKFPARWTVLGVLRDCLHRPWTQKDVDRLGNILDRGHFDDRDDDLLAAMGCPRLFDRLREMVRQWEAIAEAPSMPTTARLRRLASLPDWESRVSAAYLAASAKADAIREETRKGVAAKFKTHSVIQRRTGEALMKNERFQRLRKAIDKIRAIEPNVGWIAQSRRKQAA